MESPVRSREVEEGSQLPIERERDEKDEEIDSEIATENHELPHVEAIQRAKEYLAQMLSDPFLQDLPPDVSLDEVKQRLALEQGRAISLNLRKYDNEIIPITVLQGATVGDLKRAVEKEITRRCIRRGKTAHLSWKYVWRSYWLAYGQQRLEDRMAKLSSYGISNRDEITFVKRLRREFKGKRTKSHFNTS